jgi:CheY-like chemotaxis protein
VSETLHIFVVDDDDVDIIFVRRAFKRLAINNPVTVARDGLEALEKLRRHEIPRPHVMLLDLNMPRLSGIELLRTIRNDPAQRMTPVFVLTTSDAARDREAVAELGVEGYLLKADGTDGLKPFVDWFQENDD